MIGQTVILDTRAAKQRAHAVIDAAPQFSVVNVAAPRRTNDQNALLWAMLSDVSRAKPQGRSLPPEVWKALFMHEAGFKCSFEPTLDGQGVVPLGFKSSRLRKAEFSDLIEAIRAFAAEHGIALTEERQAA